jgi:HK97 family phage portal protein
VAVSPQRRSPLLPLARIAQAARKQVTPQAFVPPGTEAGWARPWAGLGSFARTKPRSLSAFAGVYGGTEDSVVWVYACANLVSTELASYELELETLDTEDELDPDQWPPELRALLLQPNRDLTWADAAELIALDLELTGNSYWLKDRLNALHQPLELLRFKPEQMKIAKDRAGRKLGYLYMVNGVELPYNLDEIIHFKYANPNDDLYGMGKVEALQRTLGLHLAETDHILGFFRNGGRVSGVLTTSSTMTEPQWERLQEQFRDDALVDVNGFRLLLLEQGNRYDPITTAPAGSGVIDLVRMSKEEVLVGFGVPDPLLGGLLENANYKMEEAQHIFARRMVPRARKVSERLTYDLTQPGWQLRAKLEVGYTEPLSVRVERAGKMIGKGASLNELRREIDLVALDDPEADVPMVDNNVVPWNQVGRATRANGLMGTGTTLNELREEAGLDRISDPNADKPLVPATVQTLDKANADPKPLPGAPLQLPPGDGTPAPTGSDVPSAPEPVAPAPSDDEPVGEEPGQRSAKDAAPELLVPDFGPGWERLHGAKLVPTASTALANQLLADKARVLQHGMEVVTPGMRSFFVAQRKRVIAALQEHGSTSRQVVRQGRLPKKAIDPQGLWDPNVEDAELLSTYMAWVDELGAQSIEAVGGALSADLTWNLQSPYIGAARTQLGALITRVNDTTRSQVADTVEEGMRRGYSLAQIANGYADEDYAGIQGVFDDATAARAETIARSETAMIYNAAANAGYRELGIQMVAVLDGEGDDECAEANGSTWTIDDAEANPIAHPNCVRSFVPLTAGALAAKPRHVKAEVVPAAADLLEDIMQRHPGARDNPILDEIRMRLAEMSWVMRSADRQHEPPPVHVTVHQPPIIIHQDGATVHVPEQPAPNVQVDVHSADQPPAAVTVVMPDAAEQHHHVDVPAPEVRYVTRKGVPLSVEYDEATGRPVRLVPINDPDQEVEE